MVIYVRKIFGFYFKLKNSKIIIILISYFINIRKFNFDINYFTNKLLNKFTFFSFLNLIYPQPE